MRREIAIWGLFVLGLVAMVGDAAQVPWLKGVGLASAASPLPKVFSAVDGWETYAADFELILLADDGSVEKRALTSEIYSRLAGPYNRRNVYGAALAYAPRLPESLWHPPFCYGLRRGGPLRREFGLPDEAALELRVVSRTAGADESFALAVECAR